MREDGAKRVEITYEEINDYILNRLKCKGIDISQPYVTHTEYRDGVTIMICSQGNTQLLNREESNVLVSNNSNVLVSNPSGGLKGGSVGNAAGAILEGRSAARSSEPKGSDGTPGRGGEGPWRADKGLSDEAVKQGKRPGYLDRMR